MSVCYCFAFYLLSVYIASSNQIYLQSNLFLITKEVYVPFIEHLAIEFIVCFSVKISQHYFSIKTINQLSKLRRDVTLYRNYDFDHLRKDKLNSLVTLVPFLELPIDFNIVLTSACNDYICLVITLCQKFSKFIFLVFLLIYSMCIMNFVNSNNIKMS